MTENGIKTSDVAEKIGCSRGTVRRWLREDDIRLSKLKAIADAYGLNLEIQYDYPKENRYKSLLECLRDEKMEQLGESFLLLALYYTKTSQKRLAELLGVSRRTIYKWINQGDMTLKQVYQVAEVLGWEVRIGK